MAELVCFFLLFVSFQCSRFHSRCVFPSFLASKFADIPHFTTLGSASFSVFFSLRDLLEFYSLHSWAVSPGFGHSGPLQKFRRPSSRWTSDPFPAPKANRVLPDQKPFAVLLPKAPHLLIRLVPACSTQSQRSPKTRNGHYKRPARVSPDCDSFLSFSLLPSRLT